MFLLLHFIDRPSTLNEKILRAHEKKFHSLGRYKTLSPSIDALAWLEDVSDVDATEHETLIEPQGSSQPTAASSSGRKTIKSTTQKKKLFVSQTKGMAKKLLAKKKRAGKVLEASKKKNNSVVEAVVGECPEDSETQGVEDATVTDAGKSAADEVPALQMDGISGLPDEIDQGTDDELEGGDFAKEILGDQDSEGSEDEESSSDCEEAGTETETDQLQKWKTKLVLSGTVKLNGARMANILEDPDLQPQVILQPASRPTESNGDLRQESNAVSDPVSSLKFRSKFHTSWKSVGFKRNALIQRRKKRAILCTKLIQGRRRLDCVDSSMALQALQDAYAETEETARDEEEVTVLDENKASAFGDSDNHSNRWEDDECLRQLANLSEGDTDGDEDDDLSMAILEAAGGSLIQSLEFLNDHQMDGVDGGETGKSEPLPTETESKSEKKDHEAVNTKIKKATDISKSVQKGLQRPTSALSPKPNQTPGPEPAPSLTRTAKASQSMTKKGRTRETLVTNAAKQTSLPKDSGKVSISKRVENKLQKGNQAIQPVTQNTVKSGQTQSAVGSCGKAVKTMAKPNGKSAQRVESRHNEAVEVVRRPTPRHSTPVREKPMKHSENNKSSPANTKNVTKAPTGTGTKTKATVGSRDTSIAAKKGDHKPASNVRQKAQENKHRGSQPSGSHDRMEERSFETNHVSGVESKLSSSNCKVTTPKTLLPQKQPARKLQTQKDHNRSIRPDATNGVKEETASVVSTKKKTSIDKPKHVNKCGDESPTPVTIEMDKNYTIDELRELELQTRKLQVPYNGSDEDMAESGAPTAAKRAGRSVQPHDKISFTIRQRTTSLTLEEKIALSQVSHNGHDGSADPKSKDDVDLENAPSADGNLTVDGSDQQHDVSECVEPSAKAGSVDSGSERTGQRKTVPIPQPLSSRGKDEHASQEECPIEATTESEPITKVGDMGTTISEEGWLLEQIGCNGEVEHHDSSASPTGVNQQGDSPENKDKDVGQTCKIKWHRKSSKKTVREHNEDKDAASDQSLSEATQKQVEVEVHRSDDADRHDSYQGHTAPDKPDDDKPDDEGPPATTDDDEANNNEISQKIFSTNQESPPRSKNRSMELNLKSAVVSLSPLPMLVIPDYAIKSGSEKTEDRKRRNKSDSPAREKMERKKKRKKRSHRRQGDVAHSEEEDETRHAGPGERTPGESISSGAKLSPDHTTVSLKEQKTQSDSEHNKASARNRDDKGNSPQSRSDSPQVHALMGPLLTPSHEPSIPSSGHVSDTSSDAAGKRDSRKKEKRRKRKRKVPNRGSASAGYRQALRGVEGSEGSGGSHRTLKLYNDESEDSLSLLKEQLVS